MNASAAGAAAWVARLTGRPDEATLRWIAEDGRVQGGIALRHRGDARSGQIGYGIWPSARDRGSATRALRAMLEVARGVGLPQVLVVREDGNAASAGYRADRRPAAGGAAQRPRRGAVRCYRIGLAPPA